MIRSRRLAEDGTPFERDVLASSRLDVGSDEGLKRTLVAMGLGAAAISATTSTAGAGMVAGGGASAAAGSAGIVTLVKWVGLAVIVAGSATAASVHWVGRESEAPAASAASRPAVARSFPLRSDRPPAIAVPAPIPDVLDSPSASAATDEPAAAPIAPSPSTNATSLHASAPAKPAPSRIETTSPPVPVESPSISSALSSERGPPSSLEAEIAAVDAVRAALGRGDAQRALDALSAYDRAYPTSVFAEEATVLRIDAMMLKGDRATADSLSRRFLAAHPSSAHARHVRQVLATQNQ